MEKLLDNYMKNPTPENRAKLLTYNQKHLMASCMLPMNKQVILNQIIRENAA